MKYLDLSDRILPPIQFHCSKHGVFFLLLINLYVLLLFLLSVSLSRLGENVCLNVDIDVLFWFWFLLYT